MAQMFDPYYRNQYIEEYLPEATDFSNPTEYEALMKQYLEQANGEFIDNSRHSYMYSRDAEGNPLMKTPDPINQRRVGEKYADEWNRSFANAADGPVTDAFGRTVGQATSKTKNEVLFNLSNWVKSHPEEALAAYMAVRADGKPMLLDYLAGAMEEYGIRPPEGGPEFVAPLPEPKSITKPVEQPTEPQAGNGIPKQNERPGMVAEEPRRPANPPAVEFYPVGDPYAEYADDETTTADPVPIMGDVAFERGAMPMGPAASSIDPLYPDFMVEWARRRRAGLG